LGSQIKDEWVAEVRRKKFAIVFNELEQREIIECNIHLCNIETSLRSELLSPMKICPQTFLVSFMETLNGQLGGESIKRGERTCTQYSSFVSGFEESFGFAFGANEFWANY
jgi:hypothetical protein